MKNLILMSNLQARNDNIKLAMNKAGLEYVCIDGVYPKYNETIMNCRVIKKGNAGLMLAHLNGLIEASKSDEICNIFEDDEIIPTNYYEIRNNILLELKDNYDFINFNPLRSKGINYSNNIYKVSTTYSNFWRHKVCNVWLSNYAVKPSFAKILFDLIVSDTRFCSSFNRLIGDQLISHILHANSNKYDIYVLKKSNLISNHYEVVSSRQENNK